MEKKNKLIILGIVALVVVIIGVTYAILTWTSSKVNLGLTSGCFTIDYTKGNDIANASIKTISEDDLISNNKFTIKEGIALTYANIGIKSTCTIEGYGSLYLNVISLSDAFTTGQSKGALKYAVLSNTSSTSTITVAGLLNQSFDIVAKGSITSTGTITLLTKQLSNTSLNKYLIVVYIDDNMVGNDAIGASFNGTISADANQGKVPGLSDKTLKLLNLSVSSGTPNFLKPNSGTGINGIYAEEDDLGTSYYFRGAVENNYVKFANFYWRIIRINGDGSIRMIYAGTSAHENSYDDNDTNDTNIGFSKFNSSRDDNTYVGYMYGETKASTYEEAHSNSYDSEIKKKVDAWYDTNIVDTNNEKYIADAIYCNDRRLLSGTGIGSEETTYIAFDHIKSGALPVLICPNKSDRFTKSSSLGNGKLTRMVGLMTGEEVLFAGISLQDSIKNVYLGDPDMKKGFWTMTPFGFYEWAKLDSPELEGPLTSGVIANSPTVLLGLMWVYSTNDSYAVRPVVSLLPTAISGGSGTMTDPFTVG